jgi:hypothetical protein
VNDCFLETSSLTANGCHSPSSAFVRQYQTGTTIIQCPDSSEPASQSGLDAELLLMAQSDCLAMVPQSGLMQLAYALL